MHVAKTHSIHLPVFRLMDGYLVTQLLYIAAKLDIADALSDGPQTAEALARKKGINADALRRVLRGLAAEGLFDELSDGRFGLSAPGTCLRSSRSHGLNPVLNI